MLGLKLNHVSKKGPSLHEQPCLVDIALYKALWYNAYFDEYDTVHALFLLSHGTIRFIYILQNYVIGIGVILQLPFASVATL